MRDHYDCCEECDYWESRIDIHIENEIKEAKLQRVAKKNTVETKILIPNVSSGIHKAKRHGMGDSFKKHRFIRPSDSVGTSSQ
tara:strand:- start:4411 stop:4659 length:249 start_codon:yes stop_codon:yes gene_type:complete